MLRIVRTTDEVSPEHVQAIVQATELTEIRVDEVAAGPVVTSGAEIRVRLDRKPPQFAHNDESESLLVRVEHVLECAGEGDDPDHTTTIRVAHLLVFQVSGDVEVEEAAVYAWIQTNAYFMVYPYVRQFFTAMTADMGLPPVVLGYMRRDEWPDFVSEVEMLDEVHEITSRD